LIRGLGKKRTSDAAALSLARDLVERLEGVEK
jgi:hypothetical protein